MTTASMTRGPDGPGHAIVRKKIETPLSLHEGVLERLYPRGPNGQPAPEPGLKAAADELASARRLAGQVMDAVTKLVADPSLNRGERARKIQGLVQGTQPTIDSKLTNATARLNAAIEMSRRG